MGRCVQECLQLPRCDSPLDIFQYLWRLELQVDKRFHEECYSTYIPIPMVLLITGSVRFRAVPVLSERDLIFLTVAGVVPCVDLGEYNFGNTLMFQLLLSNKVKDFIQWDIPQHMTLCGTIKLRGAVAPQGLTEHRSAGVINCIAHHLFSLLFYYNNNYYLSLPFLSYYTVFISANVPYHFSSFLPCPAVRE